MLVQIKLAGAKFDSSYDRGETATFPLNRVIPGWTEGLQLIGKGGKIAEAIRTVVKSASSRERMRIKFEAK